MNRFCELRIVDVLNIDSANTNRNQNKFNMGCKKLSVSKHNTTVKKGNSINNSLKNKNDVNNTEVEVSLGNATERSTRSSTKTVANVMSVHDSLKTNVDSNIQLNEALKYSESSQKQVNLLKNLNTIKNKKQEKRFSPVKNSDESLSKKTCKKMKVSCTNISNQTGSSVMEITQEKKRKKRKKRKRLLWENKLTGARRVSKRLTNLKIKKNTLAKLENCIGTSLLSKNKNRGLMKSAKKIKSIKIPRNNYGKNKNPKVRKSVLNRNQTEQQINYGKVSNSSKLYPKIISNRRIPTSYRVVKKKPSAVSHNLFQVKKPVNVFIEESGGSVNKSYSVEENVANKTTILTMETDNEESGTKHEESECYSVTNTNMDIDNQSNTDERQSNKLNNCETLVGRTIEETSHAVHGNVQDECVNNGSEVIIIDLESGENVLCENTSNVVSEECSQIQKDIEHVSQGVTNLINPIKLMSDSEALSNLESSDTPVLENKSKLTEAVDLDTGKDGTNKSGLSDILEKHEDINSTTDGSHITNEECTTAKNPSLDDPTGK